jgi:hypothetical protein
LAEETVLNLYYYRAWDLLFTPSVVSTLVSTTGTIGTVAGTTGAWTFPITGMSSVAGLAVDDVITATVGTGNFGTTNEVTVTGITTATSITCLASGGTTTPVAGTITDITEQQDSTIQTNPVLQTWPEGYIYGSLHEYYVKRHNAEDAAIYKAKWDEAWRVVEYQNSLGKWSGGHTRLTSIFQPRIARSYAVK